MSTDRAVVTLSPPVTAKVQSLGAQMGTRSPVEVVRRALILLDLQLSLGSNEELVIRNKKNGQCDRFRFEWEMTK